MPSHTSSFRPGQFGADFETQLVYAKRQFFLFFPLNEITLSKLANDNKVYTHPACIEHFKLACIQTGLILYVSAVM